MVGSRDVVGRAKNVLRETNEQPDQSEGPDQHQKHQQSFQHNSPSPVSFLACTSDSRRTLTYGQKAPPAIATRAEQVFSLFGSEDRPR